MPERAVVLAGGRSRRMGRDKSSIRLAGVPLLDWVLALTEGLDIPTHVLSQDRVSGLGPLGGVETACDRFQEQQLLFLSCDMPFLNGEVIRRLAEAAPPLRGESAIYSVAGRVGFPFLFDRSGLALLGKRLEAGQRSLGGLATALSCLQIEVSGHDRWRFANVNTPTELDDAETVCLERAAELVIPKPQPQVG